jgi:hypothetical protein
MARAFHKNRRVNKSKVASEAPLPVVNNAKLEQRRGMIIGERVNIVSGVNRRRGKQLPDCLQFTENLVKVELEGIKARTNWEARPWPI